MKIGDWVSNLSDGETVAILLGIIAILLGMIANIRIDRLVK